MFVAAGNHNALQPCENALKYSGPCLRQQDSYSACHHDYTHDLTETDMLLPGLKSVQSKVEPCIIGIASSLYITKASKSSTAAHVLIHNARCITSFHSTLSLLLQLNLEGILHLTPGTQQKQV